METIRVIEKSPEKALIGGLEMITNNGSILLVPKFCTGISPDGKKRFVHYMDFELNDPTLTSHEYNNLKLEMIKFHSDNFYNVTLYRSSDKNSDTLYRMQRHVKGKEFVLIPKLKIQ